VIPNEDILMKFLAFVVLAFALALVEVYVAGAPATTPCGSSNCLSALLHDDDSGLKPISVSAP
jgi:hypothetical protein